MYCKARGIFGCGGCESRPAVQACERDDVRRRGDQKKEAASSRRPVRKAGQVRRALLRVGGRPPREAPARFNYARGFAGLKQRPWRMRPL